MADVIHRTTFQYLRSVNTPDYPEPTWKHHPDMSLLVGVPVKYWKAPADWNVAGAAPVEMTQGEKDAVDAAELEASRDAIVARLDDIEDIQRAFMLTVIDGFNALRALHSLPDYTPAQLRTAIRNKLGT